MHLFVVDWWDNNAPKMIWKKAGVAQFKVPTQHFPTGTDKISKNGLPTEIWTQDFPNM